MIFFDLDHTMLDSSHRQRFFKDGSIDLNHWRKHANDFEQCKKDKIINPKTWKLWHSLPKCQRAINTARLATNAEFLGLALKFEHSDILCGYFRTKNTEGLPDAILKINTTKKVDKSQFIGIVDDNPKVRAIFRRAGFWAIHPEKLEKRK